LGGVDPELSPKGDQTSEQEDMNPIFFASSKKDGLEFARFADQRK
jgi:hypothetical protein